MNYFLRSASFIFHPLLMPLISVGSYFILAPRFNDSEIVFVKAYSIIIITVIIPLIFFFSIKSIRTRKKYRSKGGNRTKISSHDTNNINFYNY